MKSRKLLKYVLYGFGFKVLCGALDMIDQSTGSY